MAEKVDRRVRKTKEQLRRHYVRALHKVIDEADIIVLVLDARDPEGCRSRLVEIVTLAHLQPSSLLYVYCWSLMIHLLVPCYHKTGWCPNFCAI